MTRHAAAVVLALAAPAAECPVPAFSAELNAYQIQSSSAASVDGILARYSPPAGEASP